MATGDDFLWPPETFEDNQDPNLAQKLQATVDIIFAELRRLQSSAVSIDGHTLLIDAGNIDQGILAAARYPHNLLSTPHTDTTPASPALGDLVVAQRSAALDVDRCYLDGLPYDSLPNSNDAGAEAFWLDGVPADGLASTSLVTWQRKGNGAPGSVLTAGASGPDWQPAAGTALGVSVYRATDLVILDRIHTVIPLSTVIADDGAFWSAGLPTRLTVPAGQAGWYAVVGQIATLAATGRRMYTEIYVNGTLRARCGGDFVTVQAAVVIKLAVGDYVELYGYTDQDVPYAYTETALGGAASTLISMVRT